LRIHYDQGGDWGTWLKKQSTPLIAPFLFLKLIQNLLDHLPVFQADGHKDGFHWPGTSHVNSCMGVKFGPVKEPIKDFLILLILNPNEIPSMD